MYAFFSCKSSAVVLAEITESLESTKDYKLAMRKVGDLNKMLRLHGNQIILYTIKRIVETVTELPIPDKNSYGRIYQNSRQCLKNKSIAMHAHELDADSVQPTYISSNGISVFRKGRFKLLLYYIIFIISFYYLISFLLSVS